MPYTTFAIVTIAQALGLIASAYTVYMLVKLLKEKVNINE